MSASTAAGPSWPHVDVVMPTDPSGEHRHENPPVAAPPAVAGHQLVVTFNAVSWDTHILAHGR